MINFLSCLHVDFNWCSEPSDCQGHVVNWVEILGVKKLQHSDWHNILTFVKKKKLFCKIGKWCNYLKNRNNKLVFCH